MASRTYSKGKSIPPKLPKPITQTQIQQQNPLTYQFKKAINHQQRKFKVINVHCDQMEKSLSHLQNTITDIEKRIQLFMENRGSESLQNLKDQQNTFIIQELNIKIKKQQRRQVDLIDQLKKIKIQNTKLKDDLQKSQLSLKERQKKQTVQLKQLKNELKQKKSMIVQLNKKISLLNSQVSKSTTLFNPSLTLPPRYPNKTESNKLDDKQYNDLSTKLKQIQLLMSQQIQDLKEKNISLEDNFRKIKDQKDKNQTKSNSLIYQLEVRLKQYKKMNKQLQDSYNALLAKSSQNQISLHQQIMNLKKNINDEKKIHKGLKKQIQNGLHQMIKILFPKNLIFQSNKLEEQMRQVAKEVQKIQKRSIQSIKLVHKQQLDRMSQQIDKKQQSLQLQISNRKKAQKCLTNSSQAASQSSGGNQNVLNNSFNRSSQKGDITQEQKIRVKFQNMKKQIKQKQNIIYEMQQQIDQQFNQSTQKILAMQQQYLSKNNECRRKDQTINDLNIQINDLKKKLQMSEKLKQQLKTQYDISKSNLQTNWKDKNSKLQTLSLGYKTALKQSQQREQQMTSKYNKLKAKLDKIQNQTSDNLKNKSQKIDYLTKKNQQINIELKLTNEKLKLSESLKSKITVTQSDQLLKSDITTPINKDLIQQIQMQRDRILQQYEAKKKQILSLQNKQKFFNNKIKLLQETIQDEKENTTKAKNKYELLKAQLQNVKNDLKSKIQASQKQHQNSFIKLKKEYQKISNALKSSQKNLQRKRKDYQQAVKSRDKYKKQAENMKSQLDKATNKINQFQYNSNNSLKQKDQLIRNKDLRLSQQQLQITQFLRIINHKSNNPDDSSLRQSLKQQEPLLKKLTSPQTAQMGVNTDKFSYQKEDVNMSKTNKTPKKGNHLNKQSQTNVIMDDQTIKIQSKKQQVTPTGIKNDNLFINLGSGKMDIEDNFEICEQGESINIGKTQQSLKIKEIFNKLRLEIQKIFNGQDPSMSILKILPFQLQDDYNEFISYIRQKLDEVKNMNEISFINAIVGDQPNISQASLDLPDLIRSSTQQTYKKMLHEKEQIIHSLMAQKTQQQNTINQLTLQKEQIEEQNQNRFMNQCNIYKKQIKQHKKMLEAEKKNSTILQMNYNSAKNLIKNICDIWVSEYGNEQDLRDNLQLYAKVAQLGDTQRTRLNFYIMKFKQIKGIQ